MKKVLAVLILIIILSPVASAEELYKQQYELSGAEGLYEHLPDETQEFLNRNGITPESGLWVNDLGTENVFSHIWEFIKTGAKTPFKIFAAVLAVILLSAAIASLDLKGGASSTALYATAMVLAVIISAPLFSAVSAGVNALKGSSVFMTAFVPVFAVIVAASGSAVTSASMSSLLLGSAQTVNLISSFCVLPLMGGYLAISLASSVSPIVSQTGIADGIKKLSFWIMSLITTIFTGILSIQTAVNASADSLSIRTARFIVGSSVPVAGTALSEALTTVTASMGMLRSSVGIYAVLAVCLIFLPVLAELVMWRVVLIVNACVSDLFSLPKISALLRSVDTVLSVLIGIILLTGAMFVISLTVVISAGKAQ